MFFAQDAYREACSANSCDDLLFAMYEISGSQTGQMVIISPCWLPHKVLNPQLFQVICISRHTSFASYRIYCRHNNKFFTWLYCSPGASNIIDVCFATAYSDAKQLLFLGSAGTLDASLPIGSIVLAQSATTVSPWISIMNAENLKKASFDTVFAEKNQLYEYLHSDDGFSLRQVSVFSTPSIICEYQHKNYLRQKCFQCIEMEAYAFIYTVQKTEKQGTVLLCISDYIDTNRALFNRDATIRNQYIRGREQILPEIICAALENI